GIMLPLDYYALHVTHLLFAHNVDQRSLLDLSFSASPFKNHHVLLLMMASNSCRVIVPNSGCCFSHFKNSLLISSVHWLSISPVLYFPVRTISKPNLSFLTTNSATLTTSSAMWAGTKSTPSIVAITRSPGRTIAWPRRMGVVRPIRPISSVNEGWKSRAPALNPSMLLVSCRALAAPLNAPPFPDWA